MHLDQNEGAFQKRASVRQTEFQYIKVSVTHICAHNLEFLYALLILRTLTSFAEVIRDPMSLDAISFLFHMINAEPDIFNGGAERDGEKFGLTYPFNGTDKLIRSVNMVLDH